MCSRHPVRGTTCCSTAGRTHPARARPPRPVLRALGWCRARARTSGWVAGPAGWLDRLRAERGGYVRGVRPGRRRVMVPENGPPSYREGGPSRRQVRLLGPSPTEAATRVVPIHVRALAARRGREPEELDGLPREKKGSGPAGVVPGWSFDDRPVWRSRRRRAGPGARSRAGHEPVRYPQTTAASSCTSGAQARTVCGTTATHRCGARSATRVRRTGAAGSPVRRARQCAAEKRSRWWQVRSSSRNAPYLCRPRRPP